MTFSVRNCQVILRYLAGQFAYGHSYPKSEVNEILKRFHPDSATLRRELIGYGLLARKHGVSWRTPHATATDESDDVGE